MTTIEPIRAADVASMRAVDLAALNKVPVTIGQLTAARRALSDLAKDLRWDTVARRVLLAAELDEGPVAIEAIDVRLLALRKWEDLHDPDRTRSQLHLMDAAVTASLVETDHGFGFDDGHFEELVDFISELPW